MQCEEIKKKYSWTIKCCESCHEDEDMGYGNDLWCEDLDDEDVHVCCIVMRLLDNLRKGYREKE